MKIPIKFRQYNESDVLIEDYTKDYEIDKQKGNAVFPVALSSALKLKHSHQNQKS